MRSREREPLSWRPTTMFETMLVVLLLMGVFAALWLVWVRMSLRAIDHATRLGYQMGKREDVGLPDVRESPREFDMIDQREDERTQPAPQEDEDMEDEDL